MPVRPVKRGKQAIARALHQDASVVFDGPFCGCVMLFEQRPPGSIARSRRHGAVESTMSVKKALSMSTRSSIDAARGRRSGDELGDRVENWVISARLATYVEIARELDQASARDVFG